MHGEFVWAVAYPYIVHSRTLSTRAYMLSKYTCICRRTNYDDVSKARDIRFKQFIQSWRLYSLMNECKRWCNIRLSEFATFINDINSMTGNSLQQCWRRSWNSLDDDFQYSISHKYDLWSYLFSKKKKIRKRKNEWNEEHIFFSRIISLGWKRNTFQIIK